MPTPPAPLAPLHPLLLRAVVGYVALRALLLVVAALVAAFTGDPELGNLSNPLGVILLATVLGAVDIRRRGESLLWLNLGYAPVVTCGLFGVVALLGEVLIALLALGSLSAR